MRCKTCSYSPYAPALCLVIPPKGVRLTWSDAENGWTCNGQCGNIHDGGYDEFTEIMEEEGVEFEPYIEDKTTV